MLLKVGTLVGLSLNYISCVPIPNYPKELSPIEYTNPFPINALLI